MLRITTLESPGQPITLKLEGRLVGPWVGELRRACQDALRRGQPLTLDLGDVAFLDGEGIDLVRALLDRQVTVTQCSPFVAELLRGRP
jgi:anti-anti-sigma regulatory factor